MSVYIKICGMTRESDVRDTCAIGADYIGFVLHPPSKRYVTLKRARKFVDAMHGEAKSVAVVTPETLRGIGLEQLERVFDTVQLHGFINAQTVLRLVEGSDFREYFIAVHTMLERELVELKHLLGRRQNNIIHWLIDSCAGQEFGGTGVLVQREVVENIRRIVPQFFLAGGLTTDNVKDMVDEFHPIGVDVSTGVERSPGVKDIHKIEKLINTLGNK